MVTTAPMAAATTKTARKGKGITPSDTLVTARYVSLKKFWLHLSNALAIVAIFT